MREFKLIRSAIKNFSLDLNGLTVLTEAASGNYVWTPIIAAAAGAMVYAFSKDSMHSSYSNVVKMTTALAEKIDKKNCIKIFNDLTPAIIEKADIITNLGFLRPLNQEKLKYCKSTVVIPLMWETWEYRANDLDLKYCFQQNIPVLGTNESHTELRTLEFLGLTIKKLLFENSIEILKSTIGILGKGKFVDAIKTSLLKEEVNCIQLENLSSKKEKEIISFCDAIVIADYEGAIKFIGEDGLIKSRELKELNPDIKIIYLCGQIDFQDLSSNGILCHPRNNVPLKHMSVTVDYVGPKPLIDLHTAGFKVGEELSCARLKGLDYEDSITFALKNPICQDFSLEQKKKYFIIKRQSEINL